MVAVIRPGESIRRTFHYNENKVKDGVASLLLVQNYPLKQEDLSEQLRLKMLLKMAEMNPDTKVNSLHFTLNFGPSEELSDEKMRQISSLYMDRIGFGNQPYLVYRHYDSGHPHLHIVSTNIEITGKRIDLHHLGIRKSEPARKEIEEKFGLLKAEEQKKQVFELKAAYNPKVVYGRTDSRRAIANVLAALLKTYRYTSLAELNALLQLYNVKAERGQESSKTFRFNGLLYRILDDSGRPVGVPIKASSFYDKPTLSFLEGRFPINELERRPYKVRLRKAIDFAFLGNKELSMEQFQELLRKEGIHVVTRQNEAGILYGITYIDHKSRSIFNGSALGKDYSANAIVARCKTLPAQKGQSGPMKIDVNRLPTVTINGEPSLVNHKSQSLVEQMMQVENTQSSLPYELSSKKKRKRKRKSNN